VREVPVHEQVKLRDEHVSVERRPLDQPLGAAGLSDDLLRERDVELTAKGEEAVVTKKRMCARKSSSAKSPRSAWSRWRPRWRIRKSHSMKTPRRGPLRRRRHSRSAARPLCRSPVSSSRTGPRGVETFETGEESYPRFETTVVERSRTSRPSAALVIGSAVAGAIAGGVIPFMLAGRKSKTSEVLLIEDHSPSVPIGQASTNVPVKGRRARILSGRP
jgi:hypothetical protein